MKEVGFFWYCLGKNFCLATALYLIKLNRIKFYLWPIYIISFSLIIGNDFRQVLATNVIKKYSALNLNETVKALRYIIKEPIDNGGFAKQREFCLVLKASSYAKSSLSYWFK